MALDLDDPDLLEDLEPPPILYHYTNPTAFLEIVKSRRLHATEHRFVNDAGEIKYGFEIAREVVEGLRQMIGAEFTDRLQQRLRALSQGDSSFIACLSASCGVLSQWRAYANGGLGYCIGFRSARRLDGHGDNLNFWSNHLVRCHYVKSEIASRIKSGLLRQLEQAGERRDEDVMSALSYVAWRNAQIAKHEHFSEEEEWRYVVSAPPADTQYRISGFGLTPFLPTDELSIEEVWVGPCVGPDPATARLTAEEFLGQLGIEAKVSYWKSPLRR